jgi:hypothetical protein
MRIHPSTRPAPAGRTNTIPPAPLPQYVLPVLPLQNVTPYASDPARLNYLALTPWRPASTRYGKIPSINNTVPNPFAPTAKNDRSPNKGPAPINEISPATQKWPTTYNPKTCCLSPLHTSWVHLTVSHFSGVFFASKPPGFPEGFFASRPHKITPLSKYRFHTPPESSWP